VLPALATAGPISAALAPKVANGKPDLTGLWQTDMATPGEIERVAPGVGILAEPGDDPTTFIKYLHDVMADYKPGDVKLNLPWRNCFKTSPQQMLRISASRRAYPWLTATPGNPLRGDIPRQIHMDGRALPVDPQPGWVGYSIAKWEGDTLVVQTAGFNPRAPLDCFGHPRSESMRMTERLRRRDFGHLDTQVSIDGPTFYSKPITFRHTATLDTASTQFF
jgi:hypothetical protein